MGWFARGASLLLFIITVVQSCHAFNTSDLDQAALLLASDALYFTQKQAARLHQLARLRWQHSSLSACPSWLQDYSALHRISLDNFDYSPASARFLMHQCRDDNLTGCPGVGDRVRGLMESFAWAVHTRRTFLIRWEQSAPLEDVLLPSMLDWRVHTKYSVDAMPPSQTAQYRWANREPVPKDITSGAITRNSSLAALPLLAFTHPLQGCGKAQPRVRRQQGGSRGRGDAPPRSHGRALQSSEPDDKPSDLYSSSSAVPVALIDSSGGPAGVTGQRRLSAQPRRQGGGAKASVKKASKGGTGKGGGRAASPAAALDGESGGWGWPGNGGKDVSLARWLARGGVRGEGGEGEEGANGRARDGGKGSGGEGIGRGNHGKGDGSGASKSGRKGPKGISGGGGQMAGVGGGKVRPGDGAKGSAVAAAGRGWAPPLFTGRVRGSSIKGSDAEAAPGKAVGTIRHAGGASDPARLTDTSDPSALHPLTLQASSSASSGGSVFDVLKKQTHKGESISSATAPNALLASSQLMQQPTQQVTQQVSVTQQVLSDSSSRTGGARDSSATSLDGSATSKHVWAPRQALSRPRSRPEARAPTPARSTPVLQFQRKPLPGPNIGCSADLPPNLRSCVFHTLFTPSPQLLAFTARVRQQLLGSPDAPYVAVHLRLGGFQGERREIHRMGKGTRESTGVAHALAAARALAVARGIAAPVLVLTDNEVLRSALQARLLPGFVSPLYGAMHVQGIAASPEGGDARQAQLTSFADLALLAGASCLVGSQSGFTYTALMWGRHACLLMVADEGVAGGLALEPALAAAMKLRQ